MSQENVELASRVMEAIGRQDADELARLADADVEWHSLFALGQVYRGHDGTRQYMSDLADAWEVGYAEVDDQLALDDVVLLGGRIHYRGRDSWVESRTDVGWLLESGDGPIRPFRAFRDPATALKAVGLAT